jgi:hypothetical protein
VRYSTQAIFFRKPDGTPWVKFYEMGYPVVSPVTEVGKMVTWTGAQQRFGGAPTAFYWLQYTVWADGDNHLTCATKALPTVTWNDWFAQSRVQAPVDLASPDPP